MIEVCTAIEPGTNPKTTTRASGWPWLRSSSVKESVRDALRAAMAEAFDMNELKSAPVRVMVR